MTQLRFSFGRFVAILVKEFIQIRRDRLTFAMMFGIPILQLTLFGYAINSDPKHLPTAIRVADQSPFARSLVRALENSGYFRIVREAASEAETDWLLATGEAQFVLHIPTDFGRDVMRGERPSVLLEADATDPVATGTALSAIGAINRRALDHDLTGGLADLAASPPPFELLVQRRYNPEGITRYNIVPGLLGVVLTMTMVVMTSLGVTRERERGTMETLLAMPVRPLEVMCGKILPYILIGYVQATVILLAARFLFAVPIAGSLVLLGLVLILFIAANLAVGFTFSTAAKSQLQGMQMAFFFFLPSILLSGFMFPFRGMPLWAQWIGDVLPLTHFLRIVRGILLKGNGAAEILPEIWPLLGFLLAAGTIALLRYRQTLD
jgi:ABC-2 type transport system permease protein